MYVFPHSLLVLWIQRQYRQYYFITTDDIVFECIIVHIHVLNQNGFSKWFHQTCRFDQSPGHLEVSGCGELELMGELAIDDWKCLV